MPQPPHALTKHLVARFILAPLIVGLVGCWDNPPEQSPPTPGAHPAFIEVITALASIEDTTARSAAAASLADDLEGSHADYMTDSIALLWYHGPASEVHVAGDFNGWNPSATALAKIPQTSFFWTALRLDPEARVEYKLVIDGQWRLDPANPARAEGGFGMNSELRMPAYREHARIDRGPDVPAGSLDTLEFHSAVLRRRFTAYVYLPAGISQRHGPLPSITVGDGNDYLALGRMGAVLDNLIGERRLQPVIGVFLDSRTDPTDNRTNNRRTDYWLNSLFVEFLAGELRDTLQRLYPVSTDPAKTAIMGASLGGLLATHTALLHPEVYGLCAAQSPAYQISDDSIFTIARASPVLPHRVYLDTGTMHDAQERASRMRDTLMVRGCRVHYGEIPEGHNWSNWRSHLDELLLFLFGES